MYMHNSLLILLTLIFSGLSQAVFSCDMTGLAFIFIKSAIISLPVLALIEGESMDQPLNTASRMPIFDTSPENITVTAGNRATLHCSVEEKGEYKVIWMNPRMTLISREDSRHIDDSRMSIERPDIPDWNLMIREVRYNDSGEYMCQINTNPVLIKRIRMNVNVPPEIIEDWSNPRIEVVEGSTVELVCNATGVPPPSVTWFKQGDQLIDYTDYSEKSLEGEILLLHNVTRYCDGLYQCSAENNVEPAATKEFEVVVRFAPEVRLAVTRMGQDLKKETMLECRVSASPFSELTWKKNGTDLSLVLQTRKKHWIEIYDQGEHEKTLYLSIIDLQPEDYGYYECAASNSLGHDSEFMLLYEYSKTTTPKPQPRTTPRVFPTPVFPGNGILTYDPTEQGMPRSGSFNYNTGTRPRISLTHYLLPGALFVCSVITQRLCGMSTV